MNRIFRESFIALASFTCMVCATWPVFLLVRGHTLIYVGIPALGAMSLTGFILRRMTRRGVPTLLGQGCVAALCIGGFLLARGTSFTPGGISSLAHSANVTVSTSVAPLVDITAVIATFLVAVLTIGIVIDVIGATSRVPMLVALPMGATFVLATMALGQPLPVRYFVMAAASWTLLLWACSESWQPTLRGGASWLGLTAAALATALALSGLTPHRSTPAFGRHGGAGGANTSVNFSSTLDLSKDLHSNNNAPVLIYSSSPTTHPDPIRVTVSEHYADGEWHSDLNANDSVLTHSGDSMTPPGYDPYVGSHEVQINVTLDGIGAPLVPAPAPVLRANFDPSIKTFRMTRNTQLPLVSQTPAAYSIIYQAFLAGARPLSNASGAHDPTVTADDLDTSILPDDARQRIMALADTAAGKASNNFAKAVALQTYFRTNPQFTYSLTLAPTQVVDGKRLDPLSNFLVTHKGYCTQYATAMIMAARSLGIPARIAIGFLPGTASGNSHIVRARDAHAWPELYFPTMGWTRFDPTPGSRSGSAPPYAPDPSSSNSTPTTTSAAPPSTSTSTAPASTSTTTAPKTPTSRVVPSTRHLAPLKHPSHIPWKLLIALLGGLAGVALLLCFLPWAGRRERSRLTRAATSDAGRDEGAWHAMRWHMADLGMPLAPGLSPRATAARFTADYPKASSELKDAVTRAAMSMEQSRYSATPLRSVNSATDRVIRTAQQDAGRTRRLRALLVPQSGLAWCRGRAHHRRNNRESE